MLWPFVLREAPPHVSSLFNHTAAERNTTHSNLIDDFSVVLAFSAAEYQRVDAVPSPNICKRESTHCLSSPFRRKCPRVTYIRKALIQLRLLMRSPSVRQLKMLPQDRTGERTTVDECAHFNDSKRNAKKSASIKITTKTFDRNWYRNRYKFFSIIFFLFLHFFCRKTFSLEMPLNGKT